MRTAVAVLVAAGGGMVALAEDFIGGFDAGVKALIALMVLDVFVGLLRATVDGRLNSTLCRKGVVRKIGYLVLVMVAVLFDLVLGQGAPLARPVVLLFLLTAEGLSILEHLALLGVPVPKWLRERLAKFNGEADAGGLSDGKTSDGGTQQGAA